MNRFLLILLFLNAIVCTYSQISFSGKINTETGAPLKDVQIMLLKNDTIVALASTDAKGRFALKNLSPDTYNIELSALGYSSVNKEISLTEDLSEDFVLREKDIQLDSVLVTTERPRVTTATGHIYYLSKKARESGNPYKALQEVPDIISNYITETVKSMDGKQLLVLVDGIKVNSGITTIDPKRIDYVEIKDVVNAKYMREGVQKILDIRLKPQKTLYQFYEYGLRNDFPHYWGSTWGKIEIGNSKFSVYADFGPEYTHDQKSENGIWTKSNSYIKDINEKTLSSSKTLDYTLMLKYKPTEKDYLAAYFQGNNNSAHAETEGSGTFVDLVNGNAGNDAMNSDYKSKSLSRVYSGTLFYRHTINDKMMLENYLTGTYNYNNLRNNTTDIYPAETWKDMTDFSTRKNTVSQTSEFSWDVNDKTSLTFGNATTYINDKLSEKYGMLPVYRHNEWSEFLYASANGMIKNFMYMVSLGYEGIWRKSAGMSDHYYRPYVSSAFTWNMKKAGSLQLGYTLNSAAPDVAMLNPYDTSTDSLRRNVGNPYLKPQETHGVSLRYSYYKNGFYAGAYFNYCYITDRYENIGFVDDNGVYTSTFENLGHYSNINLSALFNYRYKNTTVGTTLTHFVEYYPGQDAKKSFMGNLFLFQTLGKWGFYGSVAYTNYTYTNVSAQHNLTPTTSNIFVSYNITPNISLSVGSEFLTKDLKSKMRVRDKEYEMSILNKKDVFHPYILFRWTIRKNQKKRIDLDNNIVKDIQDDINLMNRKY